MAFILLRFDGAEVACINDVKVGIHSPIRTGNDVFVIGFPQGVKTMGFLPVWKRGTVASDPDIPVNGLPKFYIDLTGRGGLSGAPVLRVQRGMVINELSTGHSMSIGNQIEFLGLYSGRAAEQLPEGLGSGESTDLGFVWHERFIAEMLDARVNDEVPEIGKGVLEVSEIWEKPEKPLAP